VSIGNPEHFPWGSNAPNVRQRLLVASVVALLSCTLLVASFLEHPLRHTDFSNVWFGASMLLDGRDPYPLLGPGRFFDIEYPLLYPASSFIMAMPFAIFSEPVASVLFTGISVWLMVYGITSDGWHRLPMLASAAFIDSVMAAQWTLIMTAALFLPWLAFVTPVKPQNGLPVLAASRSRSALWIAIGSGFVLIVASLLFLPGWPREWMKIVSTADYVRAPIMTVQGLPVVLVLLRWKRPESWLVIASACLPQTLMWYSALALITVGRTYREYVALSIISTIGFLASATVATAQVTHVGAMVWTIFLGTTYLPCVMLILSRPNSGEPPAWLGVLRPAPKR
jgi:hypothetical protein